MAMIHPNAKEVTMKASTKKIESVIEKLKNELTEIGPMRPGSLSMQTRKKKKKAYGEYWHLSYTYSGKGHTEYVSESSLVLIKDEVHNYKLFKGIIDEILSLSIELSKIRTSLERENPVT